jgi:ABC-type transport system involved in multi-copper enzyme maturation permease subunit
MKRLIKAEWMVVSRRGATRGLLLIAGVLPVLVTVVLGFSSESALEFNGQKVVDMVQFSGAHSASVSLRVRHFFVLPMFILFVTGSTFASEMSDHTLRERLVRPVSRDAMLGAKIAVLVGLCTLSLAINFVVSAGLGTLWMGSDGAWGSAIVAHILSIGTDLGLIALGLVLSTVFRSGAMVVVTGLVLFVFDKILSLGLSFLGMLGVENSALYSTFLPSTGWNSWMVMMEGSPWASVGNLLVWTTLMLVCARHRLCRMDVP